MNHLGFTKFVLLVVLLGSNSQTRNVDAQTTTERGWRDPSTNLLCPQLPGDRYGWEHEICIYAGRFSATVDRREIDGGELHGEVSFDADPFVDADELVRRSESRGNAGTPLVTEFVGETDATANSAAEIRPNHFEGWFFAETDVEFEDNKSADAKRAEEQTDVPAVKFLSLGHRGGQIVKYIRLPKKGHEIVLPQGSDDNQDRVGTGMERVKGDLRATITRNESGDVERAQAYTRIELVEETLASWETSRRDEVTGYDADYDAAVYGEAQQEKSLRPELPAADVADEADVWYAEDDFEYYHFFDESVADLGGATKARDSKVPAHAGAPGESARWHEDNQGYEKYESAYNENDGFLETMVWENRDQNEGRNLQTLVRESSRAVSEKYQIREDYYYDYSYGEADYEALFSQYSQGSDLQTQEFLDESITLEYNGYHALRAVWVLTIRQFVESGAILVQVLNAPLERAAIVSKLRETWQTLVDEVQHLEVLVSTTVEKAVTPVRKGIVAEDNDGDYLEDGPANPFDLLTD